MTLIQSNNPTRVTAEQPPSVHEVLVLQDSTEPVTSLPAPPVINYAEPNAQAVSVAPQLLDTAPPDTEPFAKLAGLLPGESAVVVLRVEVLSDGRVGQVQVDVSSGKSEVDEAAIDYARELAWIPGRLHGMEQSTWVRQSVRLAA